MGGVEPDRIVVSTMKNNVLPTAVQPAFKS
jgi:hypothetical protein